MLSIRTSTIESSLLLNNIESLRAEKAYFVAIELKDNLLVEVAVPAIDDEEILMQHVTSMCHKIEAFYDTTAKQQADQRNHLVDLGVMPSMRRRNNLRNLNANCTIDTFTVDGVTVARSAVYAEADSFMHECGLATPVAERLPTWLKCESHRPS